MVSASLIFFRSSGNDLSKGNFCFGTQLLKYWQKLISDFRLQRRHVARIQKVQSDTRHSLYCDSGPKGHALHAPFPLRDLRANNITDDVDDGVLTPAAPNSYRLQPYTD